MTIVSSCPKCGAPIYAKDDGWLSILPPPIVYTCSCSYGTQPRIVTTTETTIPVRISQTTDDLTIRKTT